MANPLAKVILGNIANQKKVTSGQKVVKSWTQHLSSNEEQSLLSIINENKKLETKKGVMTQPHQPRMVTLGELSGKKPGEEMTASSKGQEQKEKDDNRIQALLSQINSNKKVEPNKFETQKGVISGPHQQTMNTLAGLSGKASEKEMMKSGTVQHPGKETSNGIQTVSLGDMSKGLGMTAKKRK
ncbi:hypothetical protein Amet_4579 [Alkaliphilus metalliredigens QYMF]|uniref:Uncharacterized protein n=1 Tax=Alkaliphilus metalliredigens (strain QYMF) TaxID=293826 RepID=A6TWT2_ALKMQ|nr:hypothetical protein [Alkaliphilus metalliredigens]ABR50650.1 hypothetical protein Amet_4579 [Alkaliphilus metalliredigens QYMF]